jgi:hypothetical protein
VLLIVLGGLHLAVTPHIAHLIERGTSPEAAAWLTPPMLLNHVVVGILLLPLGGLIAYAAPHAAAGTRWALIVSRVIALTVASLPPTLFVVMGTRYFGAAPFLCATAIVCTVSVTLLLAAFWPPSQTIDTPAASP